MDFKYRPRGGMVGFAPTLEEMRQSSRRLFPNTAPLPAVSEARVIEGGVERIIRFDNPIPAGTSPPADLAIPVSSMEVKPLLGK